MKFSSKRIIALMLILGIAIGLKEVSKQLRASDSTLGKISRVINRGNHLKVTSTSIDLNNIEIMWSTEFNPSKLVYKNRNAIDKIGYIYGSNNFTIKYNQQEILKTGHFKTNNWHSHDYLFSIEVDKASYIVTFIAKGPDKNKRTYTIPMTALGN